MKIKELAESGDAIAQCRLGEIFFFGEGQPQDYEKAAYWYQKAALQGIAIAQFNLGLYYFKGVGVSQNYEKAVYWYQKAAEQGDKDAQFNLGLCYHNGNGVPQNYEDACIWFQKAAKQGHVKAIYCVGVYYDKGYLGIQDDEKAAYCYRMAAEQGDPDAQFNLANYYASGIGVSQSYENAIDWYLKSAEQGEPLAQYQLGNLYKKGLGCQVDYDKARYWYDMAYNHTSDTDLRKLIMQKAGEINSYKNASTMTTIDDAPQMLNLISENFLKAIQYKKIIQEAVIEELTPAEIDDIRYSRLNETVINKLVDIAKQIYRQDHNMAALSCLSMAVGTIIKEYEWGTAYATSEGIVRLAQKIEK